MWKRDRSTREDDELFEKFAGPADAPVSQPARPEVNSTVTQSSPAPAPAPAPAPGLSESTASHAQSTVRHGSVLGPSLRFKGELVADEDLIVQGQLEGSIVHSRSLTIGSQGRMQVDIKARRITVEGTVEGDLHALESAALAASARVRGNVFANEVSVAEGARLNGRIDMDNAPKIPQAGKKAVPEKKPDQTAADLSDNEVGELLGGG
jgi:cytoskeletal protein CcmA (bactofilin family)